MTIETIALLHPFLLLMFNYQSCFNFVVKGGICCMLTCQELLDRHGAKSISVPLGNFGAPTEMLASYK